MTYLTILLLVLCPDLLTTRLTQDMHHPNVMLNSANLFNAPRICLMDTKMWDEISISLIFNIIKKAHETPFQGSNIPMPKMPLIERLSPNKTSFWQLGAIFENEGTKQGTYNIYNKIFLDYLGLNAGNSTTEQSYDFS
jgi:hypothetical protein